jgi:hypothetical protein
MNVPAILRELRAAGFRLWAEAGRIMVEPASRLTDDHRAAIATSRPAILAALSPRPGEREAIERELRRIMGDHPDFAEAMTHATRSPGEYLQQLEATTAERQARGR